MGTELQAFIGFALIFGVPIGIAVLVERLRRRGSKTTDHPSYDPATADQLREMQRKAFEAKDEAQKRRNLTIG